MPANSTTTAPISDFTDTATGQRAPLDRIKEAVKTGNYAGITPIDADGKPVPSDSPFSYDLVSRLAAASAVASTDAAAAGPNYLLWAVGLFAVWYVFLRKK